MHISPRLLAGCIFIAVIGARDSSWTVIRDDSGSWITLLEVSPRMEFWLRPQPLLLPATEMASCHKLSKLAVEVRLWSDESLASAKRALLTQGRCDGSCRVLPYLVDRLGLRDQRLLWRTVNRWLFVSGPSPATQRFVLRRVGSKSGEADCSLSSLVLEVVAFGERSGKKEERTLEVNAADVRWAAKVLRLPQSPNMAVDRSGLHQIAHQVLNAKLKTLEAVGGKFSSGIAPSVLKKMELALVARTLEYGSFKDHFNASVISLASGSRRNLIDEPVFVLKNLDELRQFRIRLPFSSLPADLISISVIPPRIKDRKFQRPYSAVTSSPLHPSSPSPSSSPAPLSSSTGASSSSSPSTPPASFPPSTTSSSSSFPSTASSSSSSPTNPTSSSLGLAQMEKIETLLGRVEALESMVRKIQNKTQDCSLSPLCVAGKTESRDKGPTSPKTMSVKLVDDCSEVKSLSLPGGVYVLRFNGRLVRCTDEGELVALTRTRGNVNFNRNWTAYRDGFGDPRNGDYWVGLSYLANYTGSGDRCMRVTMKPWRLALRELVVHYAAIDIGQEADRYRLSYRKFQGNVSNDGFKDMNGQPFSTRDRDHDSFVGNCAKVFGGGNWYKSCTEANLFGSHRYLEDGSANPRQPQAGEPMCWKGLHDSQGSMCSPLVSVKMFLSKADDLGVGRRVVYSQIARPGVRCRSELRRFTVVSTGIYHITLGGGAGGVAPYHYSDPKRNTFPGGRGALVRAKMLLKRGRTLAIVAGCGGAAATSSGHGGNATWLVDDESWRPILVAGGGGGAAQWTPGRHGRAEESSSRVWWTDDASILLNNTVLLRPSSRYRAYGWSRCRRRDRTCTTGHLARTKLSRYHHSHVAPEVRGGGGGGGFEGAPSGTHDHAAGGGGGSFCDRGHVIDCEKEEGGNGHQAGFLIMEKTVCF